MILHLLNYNGVVPAKRAKMNLPSEGAAEGGCGRNSAAPERSAERSEAGQRRFRFLGLCIRFGKMISKVCEDFFSRAGIRTYVQRVTRNPPLSWRRGLYFTIIPFETDKCFSIYSL